MKVHWKSQIDESNNKFSDLQKQYHSLLGQLNTKEPQPRQPVTVIKEEATVIIKPVPSSDKFLQTSTLHSRRNYNRRVIERLNGMLKHFPSLKEMKDLQ